MTTVADLTPSERLRKLADYLETVPAEQFDMRQWSCGTKACIAGHATTVFPDRLRLVENDDGEMVVRLASGMPGLSSSASFGTAMGVQLRDALDICCCGSAETSVAEAAALLRRYAEKYEAGEVAR